MSSGRVEHYVPKDLDEEKRDELLAKLDEDEEKSGNKIDRLRALPEEAEGVYPGGKGGEEGEEEDDNAGLTYKFTANFLIK